MKTELYKQGRVWVVEFYNADGEYITTKSYSRKWAAEEICRNVESINFVYIPEVEKIMLRKK